MTVSTTLRVVDKVKFSSASFKVDQSDNTPSNFDQKVTYPDKINKIKDGTDGLSLFVNVEAKFEKSTEKPSQVYVSLRKQSGGKGQSSTSNLAVNSYGELDSKKS